MLQIILLATIHVLTVHGIAFPRQADPVELCSDIGALFDACSSEVPGFDSMGATGQASCLCYSSTSWLADAFDEAIDTCASYARTALPDEYSALEVFSGFCTSVGDFINSPNGAVASTTVNRPAASSTASSLAVSTTPARTTSFSSPVPTSTGADVFTNPACSFVSYALSFCNSATPGFSTLGVTSQAPCLCYSSTSWAPNSFDGAVQTCADFVKTAEPTAYSDIAGIEGYCSSIGDIYKNGNSATATGSGGGGGGIGGGIGGFGLTTSSAAGHTTTSPATTPKPTSQTANPTPVLTTSKHSDSIQIRGSMIISLLLMGCIMVVLL